LWTDMSTVETGFRGRGVKLREDLLEVHRHSFTARKPSIN